jgi:hypothetical protein
MNNDEKTSSLNKISKEVEEYEKLFNLTAAPAGLIDYDKNSQCNYIGDGTPIEA